MILESEVTVENSGFGVNFSHGDFLSFSSFSMSPQGGGSLYFGFESTHGAISAFEESFEVGMKTTQ